MRIAASSLVILFVACSDEAVEDSNGRRTDAGFTDAGEAPDSGLPEAGTGDGGGIPDAAAADAGATDMGDPPDGGDAGTGDGGLVSEPVFLVVQRVLNPSDRSRLVFLSPVQNLDPQRIDVSRALRATGQSRARVFEGKVYVFEGGSGDVVRYAVERDLSFTEEGRFTMSNLGITRFRNLIEFISPTRAYYLDVDGARMVVWNPSSMEVSGTFSVPEVRREGATNAAGSTVLRVDDEVIVPLAFSVTATVARVDALVFSATQDRLLRELSDPRCALAGGGFTDGSAYYVVGDSSDGAYDIFRDVFGVQTVPPPCVLQAQPGDTSFNPNFLVNLRALTGRPHVSEAVGRGDGTFVTRVYDSDIDPDTLTDPSAYFGLEIWRYAIIDIDDRSVAVASSLPLSGFGFSPAWVVDGAYYVPVVDEDTGETTVYRLGDDGAAAESITATGDLQRIARVR